MKKNNYFTFHKQTSETEPMEMISNLTEADMVGRAVQLAHDISDYDLYLRTLQQEFGLRDNQLNELADKAMHIIAEEVGSGKTEKPKGTVNNPSNNAGERPIDVKKSQETFSGEVVMPFNSVPNFIPVKGETKKAFIPSFREAWTNLKTFVSYKDAKNARESTQTPFKNMWKGEVNKSVIKKESRKVSDLKPGDVIAGGVKVISIKPERITEEEAMGDSTMLYHIKFSDGTSATFGDHDYMPMNKSQISKALSNTQKQMLADQLIDEFEDSEDMNWQAKAKSWLRSHSVSDNEIKEILDVVSDEFMMGKSLRKIDSILKNLEREEKGGPGSGPRPGGGKGLISPAKRQLAHSIHSESSKIERKYKNLDDPKQYKSYLDELKSRLPSGKIDRDVAVQLEADGGTYVIQALVDLGRIKEGDIEL